MVELLEAKNNVEALESSKEELLAAMSLHSLPPIHALSPDVLAHVLEWLVDSMDIGAASLVSHAFSSAMALESSWRTRLQRAHGASSTRSLKAVDPRRQFVRTCLACRDADTFMCESQDVSSEQLEVEVLRALVWTVVHDGSRRVPDPPSRSNVRFEHARRISSMMINPSWLACYCMRHSPVEASSLFCLAAVFFDWCIDVFSSELLQMFLDVMLRALDHHAAHRVQWATAELEEFGKATVLHLAARLADKV